MLGHETHYKKIRVPAGQNEQPGEISERSYKENAKQLRGKERDDRKSVPAILCVEGSPCASQQGSIRRVCNNAGHSQYVDKHTQLILIGSFIHF